MKLGTFLITHITKNSFGETVFKNFSVLLRNARLGYGVELQGFSVNFFMQRKVMYSNVVVLLLFLAM